MALPARVSVRRRFSATASAPTSMAEHTVRVDVSARGSWGMTLGGANSADSEICIREGVRRSLVTTGWWTTGLGTLLAFFTLFAAGCLWSFLVLARSGFMPGGGGSAKTASMKEPVSKMTSSGCGGEPMASWMLYVTMLCDLTATLSTSMVESLEVGGACSSDCFASSCFVSCSAWTNLWSRILRCACTLVTPCSPLAPNMSCFGAWPGVRMERSVVAPSW
mmetsp:Transcript_107679/g.161094  ORF Transcript_107679/g.161094 Transcript_107679/m.161094 type:complete len:221 (+) Transcript_107679:116-778(+)